MCQLKQEVAKQYRPLQVKLHHFQFLFVAIATTILKVGTKWNDVHNLSMFQVSCKNIQNFQSYRMIQKSVTDWQTYWRTERKPKVPSGFTGRGQVITCRIVLLSDFIRLQFEKRRFPVYKVGLCNKIKKRSESYNKQLIIGCLN